MLLLLFIYKDIFSIVYSNNVSSGKKIANYIWMAIKLRLMIHELLIMIHFMRKLLFFRIDMFCGSLNQFFKDLLILGIHMF